VRGGGGGVMMSMAVVMVGVLLGLRLATTFNPPRHLLLICRCVTTVACRTWVPLGSVGSRRVVCWCTDAIIRESQAQVSELEAAAAARNAAVEEGAGRLARRAKLKRAGAEAKGRALALAARAAQIEASGVGVGSVGVGVGGGGMDGDGMDDGDGDPWGGSYGGYEAIWSAKHEGLLC